MLCCTRRSTSPRLSLIILNLYWSEPSELASIIHGLIGQQSPCGVGKCLSLSEQDSFLQDSRREFLTTYIHAVTKPEVIN